MILPCFFAILATLWSSTLIRFAIPWFPGFRDLVIRELALPGCAFLLVCVHHIWDAMMRQELRKSRKNMSEAWKNKIFTNKNIFSKNVGKSFFEFQKVIFHVSNFQNLTLEWSRTLKIWPWMSSYRYLWCIGFCSVNLARYRSCTVGSRSHPFVISGGKMKSRAS